MGRNRTKSATFPVAAPHATSNARGGHGHADLDFERLLADISSRLTNPTSPDFLLDVAVVMRQVLSWLGYDRCTLAEFVAGDYLNVLCSVAADGVDPVPTGRFQPHLPWFHARLRAGELVVMDRTADDLPPQAVEEIEYCASIGLRSHVSIPLRVGGRVTSVLSFAAMREFRQCPPHVLIRLRTVGQMLARCLALSRAQDEVRDLRRRLWHADRVERVSALTAAIAHDINQPLAAILSHAQAGLKYLESGNAPPGVIQEVLSTVVREEKRVAETIRSMRSLIRRDESRRERFSLGAALSDVLLLLSGEFVGQGVQVQTRFDAGCEVLADRAQIEQLVLNLLLNAAAATQSIPADRRVVTLEAVADGPGQVAIVVRDAGKGIAPEALERIFEPFWTTRDEGLGLGLPICRSIVESHGGRIWVESTPGEGAAFHVQLPQAPAEPVGTTAMSGVVLPFARPVADPERAAQLSPLVCVIDDDAAVREGTVRVLSLGGWPVMPYASADAFVAAPPAGEVGCIVLDMQMPGMSGLALQHWLKEQGKDASVVFLTGDCDLGAGVDAMKLGALDVLEKPVDGEVLQAAVQRALLRHAALQEDQQARQAAQMHMERLSSREREILGHVVRGRLNKQIAADLLISEQTVKQHRGRVMEKMGVRSVADLVRMCEAAGVES